MKEEVEVEEEVVDVDRGVANGGVDSAVEVEETTTRELSCCRSDSEEEEEEEEEKRTGHSGNDKGGDVEMTTCMQCEDGESKIEVEEECRFCFEVGTSEDELVNPCKCRGTIGKVHKSCLRHWIFEKGCMSCEICNEPFELEDDEILSPEETLALRHAVGVQQRLNVTSLEDNPHFTFSSNNLRAFLLRHERLSRWINACILMAFSIIMLLVIVFLIYNWNTYYRNREDIFMVDEVNGGGLPFESGMEVFTGFCDARRRMMCVVRQETLTNSTALQRRLCDSDPGQSLGKPCLRYSTYSIHKSCNGEEDWCSLMLLPGVQDGKCDALGLCEKLPLEDLSREEAHQFEAERLHGDCVCSGV